jgi:hypothetical protein
MKLTWNKEKRNILGETFIWPLFDLELNCAHILSSCDVLFSQEISSVYKCCNMHTNLWSVTTLHNTLSSILEAILGYKNWACKGDYPISIHISQRTISHQFSQLKLHNNHKTTLYRKIFCTVKVHLTSKWPWHRLNPWPYIFLIWSFVQLQLSQWTKVEVCMTTWIL